MAPSLPKRDNGTFVKASGILECPHTTSTTELLPLDYGS